MAGLTSNYKEPGSMKRTKQLAAAYDQRPQVIRNAETAERVVIRDRAAEFAREVMETLAMSDRRHWQ